MLTRLLAVLLLRQLGIAPVAVISEEKTRNVPYLADLHLAAVVAVAVVEDSHHLSHHFHCSKNLTRVSISLTSVKYGLQVLASLAYGFYCNNNSVYIRYIVLKT